MCRRPGGLGDAAEHDVREPPRITLREAMAAAAGRDSIASEYASGYAIVFESGLPLLTAALDDGAATLDAIVSLHVGLLAEHPDTLIARKAGADAARAVSQAARAVRDGSRRSSNSTPICAVTDIGSTPERPPTSSPRRCWPPS